MTYRKRINYTGEQKALMWDRWQKSDLIHEIAQVFDHHPSAVRGILARYGGMRPPLRQRTARSVGRPITGDSRWPLSSHKQVSTKQKHYAPGHRRAMPTNRMGRPVSRGAPLDHAESIVKIQVDVAIIWNLLGIRQNIGRL